MEWYNWWIIYSENSTKFRSFKISGATTSKREGTGVMIMKPPYKGPRVSYFRYANMGSTESANLLSILHGMEFGEWREKVEWVRSAQSKKEQQEFLSCLPSFMPSGLFNLPLKAGLIKHSGFIALYIDHQVNKVKEIQSDPYTYACALTVTGESLFILVKVLARHHEESFRAAARYFLEQYGVEVTNSPDVSQICVVSYDPDLYLNRNSKQFRQDPVKKINLPGTFAKGSNKLENTAREYRRQALLDSKLFEKEEPSVKTNYSGALNNGASKPKNSAREHGKEDLLDSVKKIKNCLEEDPLSVIYREAYKCGGLIAPGFLEELDVRQALVEATVGKVKSSSIPDVHRTIDNAIQDGIKKPILPEYYQQLVYGSKKQGEPLAKIVQKLSVIIGQKEIVIKPMVELAYQAEEQIIKSFWYVTDNNSRNSAKVKINKSEFLNFLNKQGFWQYRAPTGLQFIKVDNNVVCEVDLVEIKLFIISYLDNLPLTFDKVHRGEVKEAYLNESPRISDIKFLHNLPFLTDSFLKADARHGYHFFSNGYADVTRDSISVKPFSELPGLIWKQQIKTHAFKKVENQEEVEQGEFARFCGNITGQNKELLLVLRHAFGYLLHRHRSHTNYAAIILSDKGGRTGKGILGQAVGHMVNLVMIDGRNVDLDRPFAFQQVTTATEVIMFDDADPRRLKLEQLYSLLTEGVTVEKKGKTAFRIPFQEAPKVLITSNDPFTGSTNSHKGRKVEMELAPYYNLLNTPAKEFGHEFFQDWDDHQWNLFYNYMLGCCQLYMNNGLKRYQSADLIRQKLVQERGEDFVSWIEEQFADIKIGLKFDKKSLWRNYITKYEIPEADLSQSTFTSWIKKYLGAYGIKIKKKQDRKGKSCVECFVITDCPVTQLQ